MCIRDRHDYVERLERLGATLRTTPSSVVQHTYGYRYGWTDFYDHKRSRLGADGALAAKWMMFDEPACTVHVGRFVRRELRRQLTTVRPTRLPFAALRIYHYIMHFRGCLMAYRLVEQPTPNPVSIQLRRIDAP